MVMLDSWRVRYSENTVEGLDHGLYSELLRIVFSAMSAPGGTQTGSDPQLSLVFGTPHRQPEDPGPQQLTHYCSADTLCLSRTQLKHVTDCIYKNSSLKYLYLEGNQICSIPHSLFVSLPSLKWLDLRNNQIVSLPAEIGTHRSLTTLLLEGNPIAELPPELGNVITLKGLNLRNCPITFPSKDILDQGLQSILLYLRNIMAMRPVSLTKTPPELPVVEKLQLSELMGSSMEGLDESVDEDEMQKFQELKDKMMQLDKAELSSIVQGDRNSKSGFLPVPKRKNATTKTSIIPELPLFDTQHWKKPEEKRQTATNELKEKPALHEQSRKSQEALQKWRSQAKIIQQKKVSECKQKKIERQRKSEEAEADLLLQTSTMAVTECEETRSPRELEQHICAHVEKMQERRRNPRGTTSEQMAATEQDVEEVRKLQERLLDSKRNLERECKNSFTIFNDDTWSCFLDN